MLKWTKETTTIINKINKVNYIFCYWFSSACITQINKISLDTNFFSLNVFKTNKVGIDKGG